jgi:hypothetical protein
MTGKNAQYIEHRGVNATPDSDRDIRMEGDEAVYQEFAYGQPGQQNQQGQEKADVNDDEEELLLTANGEYVETMTEEEVLEKLMPIFYNNEDDVKAFLKEISGMKPNNITDLVNTWVNDKRISDYGNSRKGVLWEILNKAGLYTKSRQNWCRRVH